MRKNNPRKITDIFLLGLLSVALATVLVLYPIFLSRTPVHLNQDELGFSLNAYSIAKTGFDENGRFFPLYFWHLGVMWSTPIIVYFTALFLKFLPLTEMTVRLPSVVVGLVNIFLIYVLASKIFKNKLWGLAASGLLALTPVHFIHSRLLLDNLYIVPFVLFWLIFLFQFKDTHQYRWLIFASLALGIGIHSYHAARIMLPFYLLLTLYFLRKKLSKDRRIGFMTVGAFLLSVIPAIPWWISYPDTLFSDQAKYTGLQTANQDLWSAILAIFSPGNIVHRLDVFINYFNPVFLFLRGDASLIHSTGLSGVFLLPIAVFLLFGIYRVLKHEKSWYSRLLVVGFLTAPLAATIAGDHYRISRALVILPFATILSVYGIQYLLSHKRFLSCVTCYVLLAAIPLQFSYFLFDYFKDYRIRSYGWFRYNIPAALEAVINEDRETPLYAVNLDDRIDFIDRYWRFFLIKHNREDLLEKTHYFDPYFSDLKSFPENSLLLYNFDHVGTADNKKDSFKKIKDIFEPDGTSRFYIYKN